MDNPINNALDSVVYLYNRNYGITPAYIRAYPGYTEPITLAVSAYEDYGKVKLPGYTTEGEREFIKRYVSALINDEEIQLIFTKSCDGTFELHHKRKTKGDTVDA
ncbi:hypothetical protein [Bacillus velezensis]|uniref:hypothetical protein n=1 Tax=Bacillus velezensis TaxID=492670 RepID=UPI000C9F46F7|nr:hypothetical protein [Bacillus velezensis]AUS14862.1 hypothetical protein C0W57_00985 [Bacillus velezensis]URD63432.1 hypothetical protein M8X21_15670 [Bacillus velezensis]WED86965.1 hypothetical protein PXG99_19225 [Bacillus velezensis]WED87164.1 hypothetical protein PXG99_20275 [Bacillus velezensis]WED89344.1 hypothetical protein PXG99_09740 [Bacillus velezensis]